MNLAEENIDIRSEEAQEVIGSTPQWLVSYGITLIATIIVLLFLGSWFFKYPEIIVAPIVITTENPPASIMARTNSKISELFTTDKEMVKADQYLAYLENPVKFKDFVLAKSILDSLKPSVRSMEVKNLITLKDDFTLGDLQSSYSDFVKQYNQFYTFLQVDINHQKIKTIKSQIGNYIHYIQNLESQYSIINRQHQIAQSQYRRDSVLMLQKFISDADFERAKNEILQSEYSVKDAGNTIISTQIQKTELERSVKDLELDYDQRKIELGDEVKYQYDNLISQFVQFELTYIIKSPINGTVAFTKYWSRNQNVNSGELVFTVIPSKAGRLIGKVSLPVQRSGKVEEGDKVVIKLANYPYTEFGVIYGTVSTISLVPTDNVYMVEISLKNKLLTNYGLTLEVNQEMQGSAEIITEDLRLFERIFQPIKYLLKRNLN